MLERSVRQKKIDLQVTFGDHEVTAFDRPVFIAQGQRLSLLDFQEGTALGWGLEYYRMHDLAAIALVGQSTNAERLPVRAQAVRSVSGGQHGEEGASGMDQPPGQLCDPGLH